MTATEKRENVKKNYNLIALKRQKDLGEYIEDPELIELFLKRIGYKKHILDLGGGTGKLAALMLEKGHSAINLDFSEKMLACGRKLYPHVPTINSDMVDLNKLFLPSTFDGIIAYYSLFHLPKENIKSVFINIKRILKKNGYFCFTSYLGNGENMVDEPYLGEKGKNVLFVNYFDKEEIIKLLTDCGFKMEYIKIKREENDSAPTEDDNFKFLVLAKKS